MRKIHIGVISPYEAMLPLIDELKEEQSDLLIVAEVGDLERGVELARRMEQNGADILISRGGTSKMIREAVSLPVVDIHISGYDLLRSIMLATGHSDEKKALVGFPNITLGAASIISLLEIDMKVVTIPGASEVESILLELKNEGYSTVLGDVVTSNSAAQLGMNGLLIQSGQESILESLEEAHQSFKSQQKSQQVLRVLRELLNDSKQDLLLLTDDGQILFENWTAFKKLPVAEEELTTLKQQVLETNEQTIKIIEDAKIPFRINAKIIEDRDGKIVSFNFKRLSKASAKSTVVRIEHLIQLPSLVAASAEMTGIKNLIEKPAVAGDTLVLIGQPGTGKTSVARYLHTFHQKNGLFVHVKMDASPLSLEDIEFLPNSTLLLEFSKSPNLTHTHKIQDLMERLGKNAVQLIYSLPALPSSFEEELELQEALKIQLPPLVNRQEDIEYLVRQFLTEFHQTLGTRPIKVRDDAMQELKSYNWPGNLNELKAYVKKLAILEKDYVIEKETLDQVPFTAEFQQGNPLSLDKNDTLKEIEKKIIEQVLREEDFNQTKAANRLGINRATLWRKLKN
ncbi:sigma-54-dependent transcriptional regulator [uncultured Planococcus sp.]|uniref:sigma-54-dependent Fis family transcriptional regulator n=1 Tax=uncultured Planococcus sp. TaxID=337815 RepID=UPI0026269C16|nr:sigma-54-dependent transcriptional regulator [uncultured Planococcus sp.]